MTLGSIIRAARRDKGLTQIELAKRIGAGQPTLSAWERDIQNPQRESAKALARALDLDQSTILRMADEPPARGRKVNRARPFETIRATELEQLAVIALALGGDLSFELFAEQLARIRKN